MDDNMVDIYEDVDDWMKNPNQDESDFFSDIAKAGARYADLTPRTQSLIRQGMLRARRSRPDCPISLYLAALTDRTALSGTIALDSMMSGSVFVLRKSEAREILEDIRSKGCTELTIQQLNRILLDNTVSNSILSLIDGAFVPAT
jgi:hypothetical protein